MINAVIVAATRIQNGDVPEKVNTRGVRAAQMMGLRRASELVGLKVMADGLGISTRNLRQKFDAERGLDGATLRRAAEVLDAEAAKLIAYADRLRCSAKSEQS